MSNRGSGSTILPDDFVGDPFGLPREFEDGTTTAGMGFLRHSHRIGMICRVPHLDETAAAAAAPRVPVRWNVPEIDPATPIVVPGRTPTSGNTTTPASTSSNGGSAVDRLRAAFGAGRRTTTVVEQVTPVTPAEWVLACLRRGPASAQALLDRPDCPVNQSQLYNLLTRLKDRGAVTPPDQRGGPFTITN